MNARTSWDAGVVYGYGTDTNYDPKAGLAHELKSLNLMFSTQDIIKLMGPNSASYLEMSGELGTLEAGKLADVVIVGGNPLDGYWNLLNTQARAQRRSGRRGQALSETDREELRARHLAAGARDLRLHAAAQSLHDAEHGHDRVQYRHPRRAALRPNVEDVRPADVVAAMSATRVVAPALPTARRELHSRAAAFRDELDRRRPAPSRRRARGAT